MSQEKSGQLKACSLQEEPSGGIKEANRPQVWPRSLIKYGQDHLSSAVAATPKQADGFTAAEITMEGLLIGKRRFELF